MQTKTKLIFYTRNKVKPGFFTLAYQLVFEGFQIEFHAELKNELFVQVHNM